MFAFSSKSEGYASDIAYSTTLFSVQCSLSPRKSRQKSGGGFALARKPRQKSGGGFALARKCRQKSGGFPANDGNKYIYSFVLS